MNNTNKNQGDSVLSLSGIFRIYTQGDNKINVLRNVDLNINRGEIISLIGSSGSGKSSLLHIAGLLEQPDSGDITINGVKFSKMNDQERTISRRHSIGFIYQFHHLLSDFSAIDNIIIPMMIAGQDKSYSQERATILLSKLGLEDRKDHLPSQLSGGEQQRVSIARAIANKPDLLLADEPTGNLDSKTADIVFDQFISLVRQENMSVLLATHNFKLSEKSDRVISIQNGELEEC
ncbi:MAG: ABC transporter ATP-binding protein [Rhizobiales bacterium]|nr:ABC transporter ATP-binding protein [Hyphomicrobiales bacterium]MBL6769967.1 ABC transporter ATP-binding protein [Hyphomicrobiales bacterium]